MPRYSKEFIGEIKSRLRVSDVVGKFVKLTQRGNEFVGLSPFKMKKHLHSLSTMKKNSFIVSVVLNMAIYSLF